MSKKPAAANDRHRIVAVSLDEESIGRSGPDIEHERAIAIYDLVEKNYFEPVGVEGGPFTLRLGITGSRLMFDIRREDGAPVVAHLLSLTPFRRIVRDYFMICDSYYQAIRTATPDKIEAIDMGRRGIHDEGSHTLMERLDGKVKIDFETARRLFTLICAVQPFASRIDERESNLPTVLFVCSMNSVRSPIAAALARRFFPGRLIVRSAGVRSGKADGFVHEVMEEIGIDMSVHTPHTMDELVANHFDLVVTLSADAPEAVERRGLEMGAVEHWPMPDPTETEGNRESVLSAYRTLRDTLQKRVRERLQKLVSASPRPA